MDRSSKMHVCGIKADLMKKKWPMSGVLVTSPSPLILALLRKQVNYRSNKS